MDDKFLKKQIITYMGNKRKFVSIIGKILDNIKHELNGKDLVLADGFAGSGIISRLFKIKGKRYSRIFRDFEQVLSAYTHTKTTKKNNKINSKGQQICPQRRYNDIEMGSTALGLFWENH